MLKSFYKNNAVTLTIILINFLIYFVSLLFFGDEPIQKVLIQGSNNRVYSDILTFDMLFGLSFRSVAYGFWWQFFTTMFIHGSFLHLLMNMAVLFQFGTMIENYLGKVKFTLLYLIGGLLVSLFCLIYINYSGYGGIIVGARGAICVLFGYFATLVPKQGKPLIVMIVLLSFLPGVAWYAHIAGVIIGFVYAKFEQKFILR